MVGRVGVASGLYVFGGGNSGMIARLTRSNPLLAAVQLVFPRVPFFLFGRASTPTVKGLLIEGAAWLGGYEWLCQGCAWFSARLRNDVFAVGRRREPITCPTGCHPPRQIRYQVTTMLRTITTTTTTVV